MNEMCSFAKNCFGNRLMCIPVHTHFRYCYVVTKGTGKSKMVDPGCL